jgi:hypothetical protein
MPRIKSWKNEDETALHERKPLGDRRTLPYDAKPPSPKEFDRVYNEGRHRHPEMNATKEHQKPQFPEDQHGRKYDNDVPLAGPRAFLRGGDNGGTSAPWFDHQRIEQKRGERQRATGSDCNRSPFSAAHRKGSGEGF